MKEDIKALELFFHDLNLNCSEQSPVDCRKEPILLGKTHNEKFSAFGAINDLFTGIKDVFILDNQNGENSSKTNEGDSNTGSTVEATGDYNITVTEFEHGTVQVNRLKANEGDKINVIYTIDDGYEVKNCNFYFTGYIGSAIRVNYFTYTFTMPASDVELHTVTGEVSPDFMKIYFSNGLGVCNISGDGNIKIQYFENGTNREITLTYDNPSNEQVTFTGFDSSEGVRFYGNVTDLSVTPNVGLIRDIEYLQTRHLKTLICPDSDFEYLDLTEAYVLETLDISSVDGYSLSSLTINNPLLKTVNAEGRVFNCKLDFSNAPLLETLNLNDVEVNAVTSSHNTKTYIDLHNTSLKNLSFDTISNKKTILIVDAKNQTVVNSIIEYIDKVNSYDGLNCLYVNPNDTYYEVLNINKPSNWAILPIDDGNSTNGWNVAVVYKNRYNIDANISTVLSPADKYHEDDEVTLTVNGLGEDYHITDTEATDYYGMSDLSHSSWDVDENVITITMPNKSVLLAFDVEENGDPTVEEPMLEEP